jgi:7 transmembrane receptor (Secretin family)
MNIFLLFRALKKGKSQMVLLQLAVALLAVDILVLAGINKTDPVAGCMAVAALLLYFLLVAFSWMLVEAVMFYLMFVKVFDTHTPQFMLKTALPAWSKALVLFPLVCFLSLFDKIFIRLVTAVDHSFLRAIICVLCQRSLIT